MEPLRFWGPWTLWGPALFGSHAHIFNFIWGLTFSGDLGSLGPALAHCLGPTPKQGTKNSEIIEESKRGAPKSVVPAAYAASAIWLIQHWNGCKLTVFYKNGYHFTKNNDFIVQILPENVKILTWILPDFPYVPGPSFCIRSILEYKFSHIHSATK